MRPLILLVASLAAMIVGCSRSEPSPTAGPVPKTEVSTGSVPATGADALEPTKPEARGGASTIASALANPARSEADRERDARDKPEAILTLSGFGPGMTIADIFGGGGYYSEILSGVVGPEGKVLLVNNAAYDAYAKKDLESRLVEGRLPNVEYRIVPNDAMRLGTSTLDGALIVMSYHDLYVVDPDNGWPAIDSGQFLEQIATALKPDGILLIVDHSAHGGSGTADANSLHRIDESFATAAIGAYGFVLISTSNVLRNKDDARDKSIFDESIKGKTDRFVHVYRKKG